MTAKPPLGFDLGRPEQEDEPLDQGMAEALEQGEASYIQDGASYIKAQWNEVHILLPDGITLREVLQQIKEAEL